MNTPSQPRPNTRRDEIIERLKSGESVKEIAADFGVSGEAIQKVRRAEGIPTTGTLRKYKKAEISIAIAEWVKDHPGCTIAEIAVALEKTEKEISAAITSQSLRLVLRENPRARKNTLQIRWTDDQTILALQKAGNKISPLTRVDYDLMREEGVISGPSAIRIIQRFEKWSTACEKAGVKCGDVLRGPYIRTWTDEIVAEWVGLFLLHTEKSSANDYDDWARENSDAPSLGSVRNYLESWSGAVTRALEILRYAWEEQS